MAPLGSLIHDDAPSATSVDVQVVTLDALPVRRPLSVIKVDAEGFELYALRGAADLLRRHHPNLVVEIEARHLRDLTVDDVVGEITDHGYVCAAITRDGLMPWRQFSVERDQLDHVLSAEALRPGSDAKYINNFVFCHAQSSDASTVPL
jgi:hypothetical protein